MNFIKEHRKIIIGSFLILALGIITVVYYVNDNSSSSSVVLAESEENSTEATTTSSSTFYVDIKGAVKNPGVYLVNDYNIVQDVINLAGGLTSKATTSNINLSQKVTEEMVIYIFTKSELKKSTSSSSVSSTTCTTNVIEVNECTDNITSNTSTSSDPSKATTSSLININTASKDELMTLSGIGESKAENIISYRETTPFTSISDIMNVNGIGESIYEQIKDYITV